MTSGTLTSTQLPASIRAVDSAADALHDSARRVGRRVYGHPGGLSIRDRYILAEKREAYLKVTREASIQQRDKQRKLGAQLIGVEKNALHMSLKAATPSGRMNDGKQTTYSVVSKIRSAGTQRTISLSHNLPRGGHRTKPASVHLHELLGLIEGIGHTFNKARARSDLRAVINSLRPSSGPATSGTKGEESAGQVPASGSIGGEGMVTARYLRRCHDDPGVECPRQRYLRRKAAVCLQRHARAQPLRRSFRNLVRLALHTYGSAAKLYKYCPSGDPKRRAMLLARFRLSLAAYERLKVLFPEQLHLVHRGGERKSAIQPQTPGDDKALSLTTAVDELSLPRRVSTVDAVFQDSTQSSSWGPACGSETKPADEDSKSEGSGGTCFRPAGSQAPKMRVGSPYGGQESCCGEVGKWRGSGAATSAERELRIVCWALRDAAACLVQEEMRQYARRRRMLQGFRQSDNASSAKTEMPSKGGSDSEKGNHSATEGLAAAIGALLPAVTSNINSTTASPSSAKLLNARTTAAAGEAPSLSSAPTSATGNNGRNGLHPSLLSPSHCTDGSLLTATPLVSLPMLFPHNADTSMGGYNSGNIAEELRRNSETEWEGNGGPTTDKERVGSGVVNNQDGQSGGNSTAEVDRIPEVELDSMAELDAEEQSLCRRIVGEKVTSFPLLPSEEHKKRRNEAHLRRNKSRSRYAQRSVVSLEHHGTFVLPEIIKLQRLFRAQRTRRIHDRDKANREAQRTIWNAEVAEKREERTVRWKAAMSRLKVVHNMRDSPDSRSTRNSLARMFRKTGGDTSELEEKELPQLGVVRDIIGKDAPYASAQWSLAVAYDIGSWRGGLRQRYYFRRLISFLAYRRRRKIALRLAVEERMAKRLQAWATLLSEEKRSLVCGIKARAPANIIGAHLRFLSRTGTWEKLLLDLHEILGMAFFERSQAVELLSEQVSRANRSAPGHARQAFEHSSSLQGKRDLVTPSSGKTQFRKLCVRKTSEAKPGRSMACREPASGVGSCTGRYGEKQAALGCPPECPTTASRRQMTAGDFHNPRSHWSRVEFRGRVEQRLREVVDEETLQSLHPWVVYLLVKSDIQFVPSVPQTHRVGYRIDDANKVEVYAEMQLTRRYWRFLGGVSDAISYVGDAQVEAAVLAAEAGEWTLLLGFAHHLTSKGYLVPPCTLPKLSPSKTNEENSDPKNVNVLGAMSKHTDVSTPLARRHHAKRSLEQLAEIATVVGGRQKPELATVGGRSRISERLASFSKAIGRGKQAPVSRWLSADKNLCEKCWALRSGASVVGGSKCQRCGQTHCRGFSQDVSKRCRDGDEAAGPVPWQQFAQVEDAHDLFVIHAAHACVLHPGCGTGPFTSGSVGGLGWWSGGNAEETWWRAVSGGKRAANSLRSHGCYTIGQLYKYVQGPEAASSASPANPSSLNTLANAKSARHKKLLRVVQDEDLALKISSLMLKLMWAFKELRTQRPWPTVSSVTVDRALRDLPFPRVNKNAPTRKTVNRLEIENG